MAKKSLKAPKLDPRRIEGISASEIAGVAGVSPYSSPWHVYMKKKGLLPPERGLDVGPKRWGTKFEPEVLAAYIDVRQEAGPKMFGWRRPETIWSKRYPKNCATPDLIELDEKKKPIRVVEAKIVGDDEARGFGEAGTDDIPLQYLCQVQWSMDVTELPVADVATLYGRRWEFGIYPVSYDATIAGNLREAADEFRELYLYRDVSPPIPEGERVADWLQKRFGVAGQDWVEAASDDEKSAEAYFASSELIKQLEAVKEAAKHRLQYSTGEAQGVRSLDWYFSWKPNKPKEYVAWPELAGELVSRGKLTQEELDVLRVEFTRTEFSSRRSRFQPKAERLLLRRPIIDALSVIGQAVVAVKRLGETEQKVKELTDGE